jgi:hypothetical protein
MTNIETYLLIVLSLIIGFAAGYLFKGALLKEDWQIYKNHKDVINWLKSDLAQETKNKMAKRKNQDKIRYLKTIITRLSKNI